MSLKSFKLRLIVKVLLLAAALVLFAFLIYKKEFLFVTAAVALLCVYQVYALIHFTDKTNRDLSRFLFSMRYGDTSQAFTGEDLGSSFRELKDAFNQVMHRLRDARSEMEVQARYLNAVIQHVGIGLLAYRPDGKLVLINDASKKILKVAGLSEITSLRPAFPELVDTLLSLKNGDKKLVKFQSESETGYLSIFARTFLLRQESYTLVSIQNIQAELEEKEMEAWQNLIKVLTHEIMNSMTPISSMTATLLDMLSAREESEALAGGKIGREETEEVVEALKTIHRRSQGLMSFVDSYRNMTLIPKPKFRLLSLSDFFRRVEQLMNPKVAGNGIVFCWSVEPETLELTADPDLMEQVLINLLLNAIDAVAGRENPRVTLLAFLSPDGKITITVEDNGIGIVEEALGKIFIPFFTTKKNGSGIGLSLSRQILRLHNATISAKSKPDEGSLFTLRFA